MRAELKSLCIWEGDTGPESFVPDDPERFGVYVQAFIGSEGDSRSDSFDFTVCSLSWLADNFQNPNVSNEYFETANLNFGTRLVLMKHWDYAELWACIQKLCAEIEGSDWGTVANQLGRWMPWEFDDQFDEALKRAGGIPFPPEGE